MLGLVTVLTTKRLKNRSITLQAQQRKVFINRCPPLCNDNDKLSRMKNIPNIVRKLLAGVRGWGGGRTKQNAGGELEKNKWKM